MCVKEERERERQTDRVLSLTSAKWGISLGYSGQQLVYLCWAGRGVGYQAEERTCLNKIGKGKVGGGLVSMGEAADLYNRWANLIQDTLPDSMPALFIMIVKFEFDWIETTFMKLFGAIIIIILSHSRWILCISLLIHKHICINLLMNRCNHS